MFSAEPAAPATPAVPEITYDQNTHNVRVDGHTIHQVQKDETAWGIATGNNVSLERLAEANDTTVKDLRHIRTGQQLVIPEAEPAAPATHEISIHDATTPTSPAENPLASLPTNLAEAIQNARPAEVSAIIDQLPSTEVETLANGSRVAHFDNVHFGGSEYDLAVTVDTHGKVVLSIDNGSGAVEVPIDSSKLNSDQKAVLDQAIGKIVGEPTKLLSPWDQGRHWVEHSNVDFVDGRSRGIATDLIKDMVVAGDRLQMGLELGNQERADRLLEASNDTWAKFLASKDFSQMSPIRQLMMGLDMGSRGGILNTDLTTSDLQGLRQVLDGKPVDAIQIDGPSALDKFAIAPAFAFNLANLRKVAANYKQAYRKAA